MITSTDLPCHVTGDTFDGVDYQINLGRMPLDLTGFTIILIAVGNNKKNRNQITLTITDGTAGKVSLPKQVINFEPDTYQYNIVFTYPNSDVKTLVKGIWQIIPKL